MKKLILLTFTVFAFTFSTKTNAQMLEGGSIGVGAQFNTLFYGISAKYNITDVHNAQFIVGGANYGYSSDYSSFTATGRYLYNFMFLDGINLKTYGFGQLGYWSVKFDYSGNKYSSVAFGVGGGGEYSFDGLEQLGLNAEVGYGTGGSFGYYSSYRKAFVGIGVHYYFSF